MSEKNGMLALLGAMFVGVTTSFGDWVWNGATKTLTDGNWVLKGTVSGSEITVTGKNSVTDPSVLDLSQAVTDGASGTFTIVKVGGFVSTSGLVTLVLPDELRELSLSAFRQCTDLETVTPMLPSGLTTFADRVFAGCTSLTGAVVFPETTTSIVATLENTNVNGMFNQTKITSCDMSAASFGSIPASSFAGCTSLEWVKLPQGITSIEKNAFDGCPVLTSVTPFMPSTITSLGQAAFYNCPNLGGDLVFDGESPVTFTHHNNNGYGVFQKSQIRSVTMTAPITQFCGRLFADCKKLEWVILPETLEDAHWGSDFSGCTSLTNVTPFLPASLTNLGGGMFDGCTLLAQPLVLEGDHDITVGAGYTFRNTKVPSVTITAPITKFGPTYNGNGQVFQSMNALQSITLPETVEWVGQQMFAYDPALRDVTFAGGCPEVFYPNAFNGVTDYQVRIFTQRFNTSWEMFFATNSAAIPLDDAAIAKYRSKYPDGMLPVAVWTPVAGRRVWLFDKTYDGDCALYVRGAPYNCAGTEPVSPSCTVLETGDSITCTAPATALHEGTLYACKGSVLETEVAVNVWANPVTNAGTSRVVQQVGTETKRLTWLWKVAGVQLVSDVYGGGNGTVSCNPAATLGEGIYAEGETVVLTAHPADGSRFIRWIGNVSEADATNLTVTVLMDSDRTCRPVFSNGWTYDATAKTITDGNWVLSTTLSGTELSVTGVSSVTSPEVLDLSMDVTGNGNTYDIVSVNGFVGRTDLTHLFLPDGLRTIGLSAFRQCTGLAMVSPLLPSGLTAIGKRSFAGCTALVGDVVFPANAINVSETWESALNGIFCQTKITSCDMSAATFSSIPEGSFQRCPNLEWVKLPQGIQSLGYDAFSYCPELASVTPFLPSTITYLGQAVFYNSPKLVGDLVIDGPDVVTYVHHNNNGFGIFEGTQITSATITAPAEQFCGRMFSNCKALEWVILPERLDKINHGGDFSYCTALTNVYFLGNCPENIKNAFSSLPNYQVRMYVPRDHESWPPFQEANVTPMTETLTTTYRDLYPEGPLPKGVVSISSSNNLWYMLWTTPHSQLNTTVILVR